MRNILIVDQMAFLPFEQRKYMLFADDSRVNLTVLAPEKWLMNYRKYPLLPLPDLNYRLISGPVKFPGYENRAFYKTGLENLLRDVNPDVILMIQEPYSLFAWQVTHWRNRFHPAARLVFYTWDNLTENLRYRYRLGFLYRCIARYVFKRSSCGIGANEDACRLLEKNGFTGKIQKVWYSADLSLFYKKDTAPLKRKLGLRGYVFGYIGRLLESKGIGLIITALGQIKDGNWSLLIVGSGPFEPQLRELGKVCAIEDRVVFIPAVAGTEVPDYLNCCDCLILPSRTTYTWKEQFGRVLIEAMACEIPVIGSSSGAIPEVIGDAGLIFREGDYSDLKEKCITIMDNPDLAASFQKSGYKRVKEYFTPDIFINKIKSIILD